MALLEQRPPDVLVAGSLETSGDSIGDGSLSGHIRRHFPVVGIVAYVSTQSPLWMREVREYGVRCLVHNADDTDNLSMAVQCAALGGAFNSPSCHAALERGVLEYVVGATATRSLTGHEADVIRLCLSGHGVDEIAHRLHRTHQAVSAQMITAMKKLGVTNHLELATFAVRYGLVENARA